MSKINKTSFTQLEIKKTVCPLFMLFQDLDLYIQLQYVILKDASRQTTFTRQLKLNITIHATVYSTYVKVSITN